MKVAVFGNIILTTPGYNLMLFIRIMLYKQCGYCKYQVSENEKYCPNCGFKNPWKIERKWDLEKYDEERISAIRKEGRSFKLLSIVFTGIFTVSTALFLSFLSFHEFFLLTVLSGLVALGSASCASGFFIYYRAAFEFKNKRIERYLINEEKMIQRRVKEIYEKKEKIKRVEQRIQKSDGKSDLKRTLSILTESHNHLEEYKKRFMTELKKIQLIRWRNKFSPIIFEWHKPGYDEGEKLLDSLDIIIDEGKQLDRTWSEDTRISGGNEGKSLINQIKGDLTILSNLQKSLLNRQARLSIQDIHPLETEQQYKEQALIFESYIEKSTEDINAHSFFKSFEELEDEYIRFQSEKDVLEE